MADTLDNPLSPEALLVQELKALELSKNPSFYRLKRGTSLLEAMLEEAFVRVKARFIKNKVKFTDENLACAILLVARNKDSDKPIAAAISAGDKPYSSLRFQALIAAESPDELFTQLTRVIHYTGGVNAFDLAKTALNWKGSTAEDIKKDLAFKYFSALS